MKGTAQALEVVIIGTLLGIRTEGDLDIAHINPLHSRGGGGGGETLNDVLTLSTPREGGGTLNNVLTLSTPREGGGDP